MSQGIIIQGFCTDHDRAQNVDTDMNEEPQTA